MIYVIVQDGVYRHEVGGAFTTLEAAIKGAHAMKDQERDEYHDWIVLEGPGLDVAERMAEVYRTPKNEARMAAEKKASIEAGQRLQAEWLARQANKKTE